MNYKKQTFAVNNIDLFKQQMLSWANQFNICCFLDNCNSKDNYHSQEVLLAIEAYNSITINNFSENWQQKLNDYLCNNKAWNFGHISYDFNNVVLKKQNITSNDTSVPLLFFFEPKYLLSITNNIVSINSIDLEPDIIFKEINNQVVKDVFKEEKTAISFLPSQSKESYLHAITELKKHIAKGNCYEINYCTAFTANNVTIHPVNVFQQLINISPTPFASFYKINQHYVLGASPERYIKKVADVIISQPIKGTIKTDNTSTTCNEKLKLQLINSEKDKAENVMVVDLVRNDLSKFCIPGSVKVEELFGVYTFKQVHQMISTITGLLQKDKKFADILEATFPMGSMTGAPKLKVMELISTYEQMDRSIYSGCIGYITNTGDFDFNVVIRSIFYNSTLNTISYKVGSGITHYSNPESEYEECILKAKAIETVLGNI